MNKFLKQALGKSKERVRTDNFSHPLITSIFEHIGLQDGDKHTILTRFSDIVHENEADDGKIAMEGWDCIHHGLDKNGRLVNGGKYWTLKKLSDIVNSPSTLREYVISNSFFASCKEGRPVTVAPRPEELPSLMFREMATSYALSDEMLKETQAWYSGIKLSPFAGTNLMRISDGSGELKVKRNIWMKNAKKYLSFIGVDFDIEAFDHETHGQFSNEFTATKVEGKPTWVQNEVLYNVKNIRSLVQQALDLGRIHAYIGGPGCGKTYNALNDASYSKKAYGWALSNTVAFSMKKRGIRHGVDVEPSSFSRVKFQYAIDSEKFMESLDCPILIDETSQMGYADLGILEIALRAAIENENVKVIIMGDLKQIPSFLSRGSVLYSLYKEFPEMFTELNENKRVDETSREMVTTVNKFATEGFTETLHKYKADRLTIGKFISECDDSTVFICGSNYQAMCVGQEVLASKVDGFVTGYGSSSWFSILKLNEERLRLKMSSEALKFRAHETTTYSDLADGKKYKVRRNEEYMVTMYGKDIVLQSLLTGERHIARFNSLLTDFEPAYAITANRAQGLEWDTVIIMYGDYYKMSESNKGVFKGNFPIRNSFEHLYVSCSRARKNMFIYFGTAQDGHLVPMTKFNMFSEVV